MQITYIIITILLCSTAIIFGLSMVLLPTPPTEISRQYKTSKCILAFAYIFYATAKLVTMYVKTQMSYEEFLSYSEISTALLLIILFYMALMVLLNPYYLKLKRIVWILSPYVFLVSLYHILELFFDDVLTPTMTSFFDSINEPMVLTRLLLFFELVLCQCIFMYQFYKVRATFRKKMHDVYSEDKVYPLKWISYAYYTYIVVSIFNLFSHVLISGAYWVIYMILQMIFYSVFAVKYLQYNMSLGAVAQAMGNENEDIQEQTPSEPLNMSNMVKISKLFDKEVLEQKLYVKHGITIDELALKMRTNRTYMSLYINMKYNMNFNLYINMLRVEYAKQVMRERPLISMNVVADIVGFADLASFSRYFRRFTGEAPTHWHKREIK